MSALTGASVTFHTNDEDKDADTRVYVAVQLADKKTVVAQIDNTFGHFGDNSDAGPYELLLISPATREELKTGNATIAIIPNGNDTWRFNFLIDLRFADGAHLFARANGLQLTEIFQQQYFGID